MENFDDFVDIAGAVYRIAAVIGIPGGIWGVVRLILKWRAKAKKNQSKHKTRNDVVLHVLEDLKEAAEETDPVDYVVLDVEMEDGVTVRLPIFDSTWERVSPEVAMMLVEAREDCTICHLNASGTALLPRHKHFSSELCHVNAGTVYVLDENGNVVRTVKRNESWQLEGGEFHSCIVQDVVATLTYVPPLPTGAKKKPSVSEYEAKLKQ